YCRPGGRDADGQVADLSLIRADDELDLHCSQWSTRHELQQLPATPRSRPQSGTRHKGTVPRPLRSSERGTRHAARSGRQQRLCCPGTSERSAFVSAPDKAPISGRFLVSAPWSLAATWPWIRFADRCSLQANG